VTTIGIGIPFWSNVGYLSEALASLMRQTDSDWRAVVIDDASPEAGAAAVVAELGDARISFERNSVNLGLAGNFNRCLAAPGTEIVTILHADDLLEPHYVATVRAAHDDVPTAACVAPMASAIDALGRPIDTLVDRTKRWMWPREHRHLLRGDAGLARLMHAYFVYFPALSYRPALLPDGRFRDGWQQVMDVDLLARILLGGRSVLLDRIPAYRYRRHDATSSAQNARSFTRLAEETSIARRIAADARAVGWTRTARAAQLRLTVRANGAVALAGSVGRGARGRGAAIRDVLSLR
jgi:glycosyltransferase involved in cell wall biosynthesis